MFLVMIATLSSLSLFVWMTDWFDPWYVTRKILSLVLLFWFARELMRAAWPYFDVLPELHYTESTLTRFVLERVPRLRCPFRPPLWARSGHVQTLAWLLAPPGHVIIEREFLQLKDRGLVSLDWILGAEHSEQLSATSPVLLLLPAAHQDSVHVSAFALAALAKGLRPVVFQRRGYGGNPLTTPRLQPFGDPSDLRQAVRFLRYRFPKARLVAIGISTGASLLLAYLGEFGSSAHLSASAVVSPVWDAQQVFETPSIKLFFFSCYMILSMKSLIARHAGALATVISIETVLKRCWNLNQLEKQIFAVPNSFSEIDTYWERNSPLRDVDEVAVPLLALHAKDDPFYETELVPYELAKLYPHFLLATAERGGHAAFLDADQNDSWAVPTVIDYVSAVLEFDASGSGAQS